MVSVKSVTFCYSKGITTACSNYLVPHYMQYSVDIQYLTKCTKFHGIFKFVIIKKLIKIIISFSENLHHLLTVTNYINTTKIFMNYAAKWYNLTFDTPLID